MVRLRTSLSALALVALLAVPGTLSARPAARPAKGSAEAWFDFKFQRKKVGFFESMDEPVTEQGQRAIHMKRWSVVQVRRESDTIRIESTTEVWTDPKGHPIRFKQHRTEGQDERNLEGHREGKAFVVTKDVGGNTERKRFPLKDNLYAAASLDSLFNTNLKVGKEFRGEAIVEEEGEPRAFLVRVLGTQTTTQGLAFVVQQTIGGVETFQLVLKDGRTLSAKIPALGAEFEATTREKAVQFDNNFDVFSSALFKLKDPLPASNQLEELVVRLSGRSGKRPVYVVDQRTQARILGPSAVELHLRPEVMPLHGPRLPIKSPEVKAFLKETPYEPLHDERLVRTAHEVVGDERNAWDAARKINAFVHGYIVKKTLARAFATASEVLETKEGDCTEHAVLFSALAKITGIPTRLVIGLVYVGGESNVFGYHEWVEVWMGDRWVAMDPTFGQDVADATHIKFTQGQSDADGLLEAGVVAAGLMEDLELKVSSYTKTDGSKKVL